MKTKIIFLIFLISTVAQSQIQNQYYFLKRPTSNIFSMAFGEPNGKDDPILAPTDIKITDDDIIVGNSTNSETLYQSKENQPSYFFGTWNRNNNIQISGKFSNVKHVYLKNDGFKKINDNVYHVVEALRADSVEIKIIKIKNDTVSSNIFEKIVSLFASEKTVVSQVLEAVRNDSLAKNSELKNSLITLTKKSQDTLILNISDNSVYYAARYMKLDPNRNNVVKIFGLLETKIDKAPECATEMKRGASKIVSKNLTGRTTQNLMQSCQINNSQFYVKYINKPDQKISNVYIMKSDSNGSIARNNAANPKEELKTVFISEYIDFDDEYKDQYYNGRFQFVAIENPNPTSIDNILGVCDFEISFDTQTKELKIANYDQYYHTCLYYEKAMIKYFPN